MTSPQKVENAFNLGSRVRIVNETSPYGLPVYGAIVEFKGNDIVLVREEQQLGAPRSDTFSLRNLSSLQPVAAE